MRYAVGGDIMLLIFTSEASENTRDLTAERVNIWQARYRVIVGGWTSDRVGK